MTDPSTAPSPTGHQDDERNLVVSFQIGEKGAYQAIYERYSSRVRALCHRMLLSPDDAAEASQETFLRVYLALPRFNGRYQLGAWVSRIATNVCLDTLRARNRKGAVPLSGLDLDAHVDLDEPDEARDPEAFYIRATEGTLVRDTLAGLAPLHRAAIVLREFEGLSYAEIAVALDLSEPQVKALLHRARGSFKRSWMAALSSIIFPTRLWDRFRGVPRPPKAHALQAPANTPVMGDLVASSANVISSCSTVLHQCGQFMSDKVAPLFVAAAVGVVGVAASSPARPSPPTAVEVRLSDDVISKRQYAGIVDRNRGDKKGPWTESTDGQVPPPAAESHEAPAPVEPAEDEQQDLPKEHQPRDEASPSPEPVAMPSAAIGFDRFGPVQESTASEHTIALDCTRQQMSQELVGQLSDGPDSYPVGLRLDVSTNVLLSVSILKEGKQYEYRAWGTQPRVTWTESDGMVTIHIEGEYGPVDGSQPSAVGLPQSGTFTADLKVDCGTTAVVSETLILGGN